MKNTGLLWLLTPLAKAAINAIDGTQASMPALVDTDEPAPIADINTYHPDQHDCPLTCDDVSNVHSWITYFSIDRLKRCKEPMLLQFSLTQSLSNPATDVLLRACTLGGDGDANNKMVDPITNFPNPKKDKSLLHQGPLSTARSCVATGSEFKRQLRVLHRGENNNTADVAVLFGGIKKYFENEGNCDEESVFIYHAGVVAGMYMGADVGKATVRSVLEGFSDHLSNSVSKAITIAEHCEDEKETENSVGVVIDTTTDLAAVQKLLRARGGFLDIYARGRTPPQAQEDGTCATYLIKQGDICDTLARKNGITVDDIEKFNKDTWAWGGCSRMRYGYNMCLSEGKPPLPPPQEGAQCGPLVKPPIPWDGKTPMADLSPCPLKACCSNWGFCGVFPEHCDIHDAGKGTGPGATPPGVANTCISNCGVEIKQNSGPPDTFRRIGYYEAFSMDRTCLKMYARDAMLSTQYTHLHWAFAAIEPDTWKPIIVDKHDQWKDFKALQNVKRIVSFGGWAYSTEPATYHIIRDAITKNRDAFTDAIAKFVEEEGIDGVDIDWEYPGAPDIFVDGKPIGQKGDGTQYDRFLAVLKRKLGDKSVSIAAPASFWYLQAFPIDYISKTVDYIVYMTYDLHGQWDYGNVNAFDSCPSGKCIRSHVNLTETRNALSVITKAGVANNKIVVGEASYGRSFHMAVPGCWGPMCEFTGTREQSDAYPGRCTGTRGYISEAEMKEIQNWGQEKIELFHDADSNTDVMIRSDDYISYMSDITKETRRKDWVGLNFGGTVNWAIDLKNFGEADFDNTAGAAEPGSTGCVDGWDLDEIYSGGLCEFACSYGFCPFIACVCGDRGIVPQLPEEDKNSATAVADSGDVGLSQLCRFSCKYGFCPDDVCNNDNGIDDGDDGDDGGDDSSNWYDHCGNDIKCQNLHKCAIWKDKFDDWEQCQLGCAATIAEKQANNETVAYGCAYADQPPVEVKAWNNEIYYPGQCVCTNPLVEAIFDDVIEAMAAVAEIGCFLMMSALHTIFNIGTAIFPEIKPLNYGLDAAAAAAQTYNYLYPDSEDPSGAFDWWLSPCGDTSLVPDDLKKIFGIINEATDPLGSWRKPKAKKGSGKKGDGLNPNDRTRGPKSDKPGPNSRNGGSCKRGEPSNGGQYSDGKQGQELAVRAPNCPPKQPNKTHRHTKCKRPGVTKYTSMKNGVTARAVVCDKNDETTYYEYVVTTVTWQANPSPKAHRATCPGVATQACMHYSSVIRNVPAFATITCPAAAATNARSRSQDAPAVATFYEERGRYKDKKGKVTNNGWLETVNIVGGVPTTTTLIGAVCQADEYPPMQLLDWTDQVFLKGGVDVNAQRVRFVPSYENGRAGQMFKGVCLAGSLRYLGAQGLWDKGSSAAARHRIASETEPHNWDKHRTVTRYTVPLDNVRDRPEFTIAQWNHAHQNLDGLWANTQCWPTLKAPNDPGFAVLDIDPVTANFNRGNAIYSNSYVPGKNGV
ncbi:hypothetical protein NLG97_g2808 [Lecanicillium saksenae]|uniref:Uncharacterized protein n=1 Tax=Lecanicillium saksenae TaxID=468837 RepID=A0ACC1R1L7_9HYPO|nr:hypothetical protein NLG97_g2808 [Lecanicillium saksenae]